MRPPAPSRAGRTMRNRYRRRAPKPPAGFDEGADFRAEVEVARVRYETDDGDFQVLVLKDDGGASFPAVIRNAALRPGERLTVEGSVSRHRTGELQLDARSATRIAPGTPAGIAAYLASAAVDGIGPTMAKRIVDAFGTETLRVLDETPDRLSEVEGIGPRRVTAIKQAWGENRAMRDILVFLQSQGISSAYANRIYRAYGDRAIPVVQRDPYRLARDIHGIGFRIADRIARDGGIGADDARRVRAGIEFTLRQGSLDGHVYLPREALVEHAASLLDCEPDAVAHGVDAMLLDGNLVRGAHDADALYTRARFDDEAEIAERVSAHLRGAPSHAPVAPDDLARVESALAFRLADGQRRAVVRLGAAPIGVLTGGPGTGKTTIVRAIVELARLAGREVELAAPTGRAARRLSESTGREARTLHRLLAFDPVSRTFARDAADPIPADLVVVDEASMVDQMLMLALTRAIHPRTRLLLVGDVDQLPSVGAGDVLRDLIASHVVEVARLTEVFRQAADSGIVSCAHAIREGRLLAGSDDAGGDYFFLQVSTPEVAVDRVVQLVTERMPEAFGLDPFNDIQVLVPMHRGAVGTEALNAALQQALGVGGPALEKGHRRLHVGDKVMQVRNNYRHETFNGDIGRVEAIDPERIRAAVRFDDRLVELERDDLDELEPAYAVTVHKSQGSEFRAVVLVLTTHHFKLLQRNLLYTAVTRARERLVIVGQRRAVQMAIDNAGGVERYTGLADRLRSALHD